MATMTVTIALSAPATISLPGDRAFPESVTSTADGTLYASSIASGGVIRVRPGAAAEVWIKPGAFGTRSTFGLLADEKAGLLWVCSNDASAIGLPGPTTVEGAYVKGFDLATGVGKVSARLSGKPALCNDMAQGPDGTLYVSDTLQPRVLTLRPGATTLEVFATDPLFAPTGGAGLDGIAFGGDGALYLDKFSSGEMVRLAVTDGKAGKVTALKTSRTLKFPDGLRPLSGTTFLLAEGGGSLDRVSVSGDTATIETIKGGFVQPTGVTLHDGVAWVADGQLSRLGYPKKGEAPSLPFTIVPVPLAGTPAP